jgi:hypothetical protein
MTELNPNLMIDVTDHNSAMSPVEEKINPGHHSGYLKLFSFEKVGLSVEYIKFNSKVLANVTNTSVL